MEYTKRLTVFLNDVITVLKIGPSFFTSKYSSTSFGRTAEDHFAF